jgi:carbon storage regulator
MLVLNRHKKERIIVNLGDKQLVFEIIDVRGNNVRIGITAPPEFRVDREEIYQSRMQEHGRSPAIQSP